MGWKKEQQKDTKLIARISQKLKKNFNNKEVNELGGIEMNEKATPKGDNAKDQEEVKGDGHEMNEGQSEVTSEVTGTMSNGIEPVQVTETTSNDSAAYSDASSPQEAAVAQKEAASDDQNAVKISEITLK